MPTYDLHQHLWPEPLLSALSARREPPRLRGRMLELPTEPPCELDLRAHALDARLAELDRHGIDVAVVSLPPTAACEAHEDLREAYHAGIAELVEAARGRLAGLAAAECRPGFAGACVSADALVEGIEPLLAALEEAGQLLFVHPGPPRPAPAGAPAWWPAVVHYTAQLQAGYAAWLARDAVRHPSVPVVFSALAGGGPFQLERLASRGVEVRSALHPNVYFETSSYGRRSLELCLSTFGVTQLVFGSDLPVVGLQPALAAVRGFGDALAELVLADNPGRALGRVS